MPGRMGAHANGGQGPSSRSAVPAVQRPGAADRVSSRNRDTTMHRAGRPPDGHLNRLDVAGPVQDGVGAASLTAKTQVVEQPRPGRRPAAAARCFWTARRRPARQAGERQPSLPATARCRRRGRAGGPAGPGSTAPGLCGPESGVAPAQRRPAATPASRQRHGPLLLGRCGACPPP